MKKILLASTILVGSAGIAAADNANFTFKGEAYAGLGWSTNANFSPEIEASFTVGMMTTADMGLEAGAEVKVSAAGWTFDDDNTTTTFGTLPTPVTAGSISDAKVYLSGDFGRVDVIYDANGASGGTQPDVEFKYSNTFGDFKVAASYWWSPGTTNNDIKLRADYSFGDYSVYGEYMWDNNPGEHELGLGGKATFSGFTASVDVDYNVTTAVWGLAFNGEYTTGAITVGAFASNEDVVGTPWDFGANGAYDLGGGVKAVAEWKWDGDSGNHLVTAGVSMSF